MNKQRERLLSAITILVMMGAVLGMTYWMLITYPIEH